MKTKKDRFVTVDARNRVSLTKVSSNLPTMFKVYQDGDKIILEPVRDVAESDQWLFKPENRHILKKVKEGLQQEGTVVRESFAKHLAKFTTKKSKKSKN